MRCTTGLLQKWVVKDISSWLKSELSIWGSGEDEIFPFFLLYWELEFTHTSLSSKSTAWGQFIWNIIFSWFELLGWWMNIHFPFLNSISNNYLVFIFLYWTWYLFYKYKRPVYLHLNYIAIEYIWIIP